MYATRITTLRKTTKDPRTGQLHHRKPSSHCPVPEQIATNTSNLKVPDTEPTNFLSQNNSIPTTNTMPAAETQTEGDTVGPIRDEELHQKLDSFVGRFDKIEKISEGYKVSLEFTQEEVKELKEENISLKEALQELSLEIKRNTYAIQGLTTKHENLDTNTRKKNLIFEGLPERQDQGGRENLHEAICQILSELGITKPVEYDAAYRLGQNKQGKHPRPLLVSFVRQDDRNFIFSKRAQLRDSPHFSRVWVSEDVSSRTRRVRGVIREVAKEARNQGAHCVATPNSVTINHRKYTEATLDDLPPEFAVEKTKMKKMGDTLAYRSEHAPFSNLYPANTPVGKHNYLCSEQAFRHIRATENKSPNVAARILWSRDPYDMMEADRDLTLTESWKKKEDFVLFKCMYRKFEANQELRELLVSTGDLELAEATRNQKWATGASINSTMMKTHTWKGENKQGKSTMKIREYFRMNAEEYERNGNPEPVSDSFLEHLYKEP